MKPKKCKAQKCGIGFSPSKSTQKVCSMRCAISYSREQAEKKALKENRKRKESLKTRSDYMRDAQRVFNAFIRERDKNEPCISCGGTPNDSKLITGSKWDAGHFFSIGAHPALRFDERNCVKQCVKCNRDLSGNIHNYRLGLIDKMGAEEFAKFESEAYQAEPKKYSSDDLKEIIKIYREKTKQMRIKNDEWLDGQRWLETGEI